jgi:hypothetical protein
MDHSLAAQLLLPAHHSHRTIEPDNFVVFFADQMFLSPAANTLFLTEHDHLARTGHFMQKVEHSLGPVTVCLHRDIIKDQRRHIQRFGVRDFVR